MLTTYSPTYKTVPLFLLAAAISFAQAEAAKPTERRQAIGFRVSAFPIGSMSVLGDATSMTTTLAPTYDWQFRTTSRSPALSVGPAIELMLGKRATISAELLFHRLRYDKVTSIRSGSDDPNTNGDERSVTTKTEQTKARLWDVPVMIHYRLGSAGLWSRAYVAGGAAYRSVSKIRTETETVLANAETSNDYTAAVAAQKSTFGAVIGFGFRLIDDFNIKSTPEIRFTRWQNRTFDLDTTRTSLNQLELGIGFTF